VPVANGSSFGARSRRRCAASLRVRPSSSCRSLAWARQRRDLRRRRSWRCSFGGRKEQRHERQEAHRDATLRDQALRSAKSACLNTAEGAGRVSRADKARAFAIARGEVVEAAAAVEIAGLCGEVPPRAAAEVSRRAERAVRLLTGLCR
jgi:four helix bundle protein